MSATLQQVVDIVEILHVFDADTHPVAGRPLKMGTQFADALSSFRQDLILVPVRPVHDIKNLLDVGDWHVLVEHLRLERQFKPVLVV